MRHPPPLPTDPAQAYEYYRVPGMFRPWAGELLDRANPQRGQRILDLACGTGIVARLAVERLAGQAMFAGLDLSAAMIAEARASAEAEGAQIAWHVGDAAALPFPDGWFDLVLVQQGLQFFPDRVAAALEMFRVLEPGGRAAASTWTEIARNPFNQAMSEVAERRLGSAAMAAPFALSDRDELRAVFVAAGFDAVEIEVVRRDVWFAEPDRFVDMTVASFVASVPALQAMDAAEWARLADEVREDFCGLVERHTVGDRVIFSTETHIAMAGKPTA